VSAIAFGPVDSTIAIYVGAASGGLWRSVDDGRHWTPLTDDQVSLAVGAIAVSADGNTIYVGTGEDHGEGKSVFAGAGLLTSTDGGAHFSVEPDPQASQTLLGRRISAIAIDPRDSRHLFIASDIGVWETGVEADGVRRWRVLEDATGSAHIASASDLEVDWRDPARPIVYAAFRMNLSVRGMDGVYRTDAAGKLVPITPPRFDGGRILLARSPTHPDTLYAAVGPILAFGVDIRVSTNGGDVWTPMPDLHRLSEAERLDYNFVLEVDPTEPGAVFFGEARLWRYTPLRSWHKISEPSGSYRGIHVDQHALAFHPTDRSIWAGNDGGVWVSRDHGEGFSPDHRGERFAPRNRGLQNLQAYSVAHHPSSAVALLTGTQDNGLQRYVGHPAWQMVGDGDGSYTAIDPSAPHRWYGGGATGAVVGRNAIQRSDESGARWSFETVVDGLDGQFPFYVPFVVDPSQEGVLYAGLDALYRSGNRGRRWQRMPITESDEMFNGISAIAVAPSDSNVVYLARESGACARLERQPDGTWEQRLGDAKIGGFPETCRMLAVDPQDPFVVYAAIGSWDGPAFKPAPAHLYRGTLGADGGLHIEPLGHVADLEIATGHMPPFTLAGDRNQINALVIDPDHPTHLYAGCDVGVFRSTDAGASWQHWTVGLPNVVVSDLQFHRAARLVRASTLGRGVWERPADDPPVVPPTPQVDIYVRDYLADVGRTPSLGQTKHPVKFDTIRWTDGIDIKVDTDDRFVGGFKTPSSTIDYAGGAADYLGFEALGSDDVRPRTRSRVYVQVHNRGPDTAADVHVRAYFAPKGEAGYPDVPEQFWTAFPGDAPDLGAWTPLGPAQTIVELVAAAPEVVRFDFDFPSLPDAIGILVAISTAHDPLPNLPRAVEDAVRADKHVALKEVSVGMPSYQIVLIVLGVLGVVTAAVVVAESD
jgi:hypothetical protein